MLKKDLCSTLHGNVPAQLKSCLIDYTMIIIHRVVVTDYAM